MSYITPCVRAGLVAKLARWVTLREKAETAYEDALIGAQSYRLDTGEGSQQTKNRDLDQLVKNIDMIDHRIRAISDRLRGIGIMNLNLRR